MKYFSVSYVFSAFPQIPNNVIFTYVIVFTILLISGIIFSTVLSKKSKKIQPYKYIRERVINHTLAVCISGYILTFFAWQQIPYLAAPIVIYVFFITIVYLIVSDVAYYFKVTKNQIKTYNQELNYQKYLPKKKKQSK